MFTCNLKWNLKHWKPRLTYCIYVYLFQTCRVLNGRKRANAQPAKRQFENLHLCEECCTTDFCNRQGCPDRSTLDFIQYGYSILGPTNIMSCLPLIIWIQDWLIIYRSMSQSRIFLLYGEVTIAGKGLQNLGLCSALRAIEQGGIFIVPHLLWHRASVFPVSHPKDRPIQSPLMTQNVEDLLTRILTGFNARKISALMQRWPYLILCWTVLSILALMMGNSVFD
jgi:hypothetical protein